MALKKKKVVKKKIVKKLRTKSKVAKTKAKPKSKAKPKTTLKIKNGNIVGKIIHYFPHVKAAVIKLSAPLSVGDKIKVKGHTTDFTQIITSMQMDRVDIKTAKPKQEIGLLVNSRVRQHDIVYKV